MKWINVNDRLPQVDDRVLVYTSKFGGKVLVMHRQHDCDWWHGDSRGIWIDNSHVSHWQPLPVAPVDGCEK